MAHSQPAGPSVADIDWHREMLADRARVEAFRNAVAVSVKPGDVVVDIGTGTGLLALLAVRAGASRVYAIEQGEIIELARQIAIDNGIDGQIVFLRGHSTEISIDERADVLVSELIGSFGLDEDILSVLQDGCRRFLKPGGRLVPDALDLVLAPTEEGESYSTWSTDYLRDMGLDFTRLADLSQHRSIGVWANPEKLLAPPTTVCTCDLRTASTAVLESGAEVTIARDGLLCGWLGWFEARYGGRPLIDTQPPITGSSWENVIFPIGDPVRVVPGNRVRLKLQLNNPFWSWEFQLEGHPVRAFSEFSSVPPSTMKPACSNPSAERRAEPLAPAAGEE